MSEMRVGTRELKTRLSEREPSTLRPDSGGSGMILYLDTSALIKRYVVEAGSNEVTDLVEQSETVGSVLLTRIEMAAALSKSVRMNWVESGEAENAWQDFLAHWQQSFTRLSITPALAERAAEMPVTLAKYNREF